MAVLSGQKAETVVADWLSDHGYQVLERNWKTAVCEIDIVARKASVIYFVEVKYRQSDSQGSGWDYILPRKLKQMEFAARIWNQRANWSGDWRMAAAAVDSDHNIDLIEIF